MTGVNDSINYDSTNGVQQHLMSELEKAANIIGLDRHSIQLTVEKPNPSIVNSQTELMYIRAQQFLQGFRKHRIEDENPKMSYDTLGQYIDGLKKGQLHKYMNDTDITDTFETFEATPLTIFENLRLAYNHGLKKGFEEASIGSDYIFDDIPKYLFSNIIAKVITIKPVRAKEEE